MPGPWEQYAAAPDAAPAGPWSKYAAPDQNSDRGFVRGFVDSVNPLPLANAIANDPQGPAMGAGHVIENLIDAHIAQWQKARDAWVKGDHVEAMGHAGAALLPVVGPAAAAAGEKIGEGKTGEGLGEAAGLIGSTLLAHPAAKYAGKAIGAAPDAIAAAADTLRSALPDSIPTVPGALSDAVGVVSPRAAHALSLVNRGAKAVNAVLGAVKEAPLTPGEEIMRSMRAMNIEADRAMAEHSAAVARAEAEAAAAKVEPRDVIDERPDAREVLAETPAEPEQEIQTGTATPKLWPPAAKPSTNFQQLQKAVDAGNRGAVEFYANKIEAEQSMPAHEVPTHAPGEKPPAAPAIDAAQRVEEAGSAPAPRAQFPDIPEDPTGDIQVGDYRYTVEQAARAKARNEEMEWSSRARKADRFAAYFLKNKLDPTPENLASAAKQLAEREVPSAETADMIHDRMGYTAPEASGESALEQQLRASIEAAQAKRNAPAPPEASALGEPLQKRLGETLAPQTQAPKPGTLAQLDPKTISVDPVRFQFKRDTGGAAGVSAKLKSIDQYDPELGGTLSVWVDPADGRTYVINGHHRLELAQRTNAPTVDVRYIDAPNAQAARAKGALINIAEDQGTPLDAAKLFRDTGITPADLKARNIALDGKVARAGLGLSNLEQSLFDGVVKGDIPQETGAAIGELLPGRFADQRSVMDAVNKAAARGKQMSPAQISESIRVGMRPGNDVTSVQDTLFGSVEDTRSLFPEIGELSDYVRKQLGAEKRTFGTVSKSGAADQLAKAGNTLNAAENLRIAAAAKHAQAVYDKLSGMSGPVSDAIAAGARQLAEKGVDANAVKQSSYEAVRKAISQIVPVGEGRVSP